MMMTSAPSINAALAEEESLKSGDKKLIFEETNQT